MESGTKSLLLILLCLTFLASTRVLCMEEKTEIEALSSKEMVRPSAVSPPKISRRLVAVQGVVYCKSCKYAGADTLLEASPLQGATVRLLCNNTKKKLTVDSQTDKNGYFFLQAPKKVTTYAFHTCRVSLLKSPVSPCSEPSQLNGGAVGAVLKPVKPIEFSADKYVLFSVGPFAFEPTCPR